MTDLYREIRKDRIILEKRKPWKKEAADQILEWETGQFVYSCMHLDGKLLTREAVASILAGDVVKEASFADYAQIQGLETATLYLRKIGDTPTEAELCLLWCFLEGKSEEEARKVWEDKGHLRKISPVVHALSHVPCHFSELPGKMDELFRWLKKATKEEGMNVVSVASEFHNRLLALYPFESHNEDIAKLAAESVLLANGLPLVPWSMTEPEYYEAGRVYLDSVEAESYDEDGFAAGTRVLADKLETLVHRCQGVELRLTEEERHA